MSSQTTTDAGPALEAHRVVKRFGPKAVLDGVDLTVERGEFVCITGGSGAGKSTLLNLLGALDRPDDGEIVVDGHDIRRRRGGAHFRRHSVGFVFQMHNLVPNLTALENVEVAMLGAGRHRRQRIDRARELLALLGLADMIRHRPPTLSGGERQRVAIARALANDPAVLLADEPTSSLDDDSADVAIAALTNLQADGVLTVVAISHDARFLAHADRVLRLEDGHLMAPTEQDGDT